ncbi:MAG: flagellar biosynthetic protein FliR [Steroidobacteraceae bacterium]
MSISIDIGWLLATLLIGVRVTSAFMLVPVLGPAQIPPVAKIVLVLTLSAMLVSYLPATTLNVDWGVAGLAVAAAGEAFVGAAFAFGFIVAYAATHFAGRVLDIQMGFGAANVLNPTTQTSSPLIGSVLGMVAVAVFLSLNGHHVLIKALALSTQSAPIGDAWTHVDLVALMRHSTLLFSFGLALSAPVMFALLLADVAMAVFARSMPQLNVFVLSFAVKIVMGLTGLALAIRFADGVLIPLFERVFRLWAATAGA